MPMLTTEVLPQILSTHATVAAEYNLHNPADIATISIFNYFVEKFLDGDQEVFQHFLYEMQEIPAEAQYIVPEYKAKIAERIQLQHELFSHPEFAGATLSQYSLVNQIKTFANQLVQQVKEQNLKLAFFDCDETIYQPSNSLNGGGLEIWHEFLSNLHAQNIIPILMTTRMHIATLDIADVLQLPFQGRIFLGGACAKAFAIQQLCLELETHGIRAECTLFDDQIREVQFAQALNYKSACIQAFKPVESFEKFVSQGLGKLLLDTLQIHLPSFINVGACTPPGKKLTFGQFSVTKFWNTPESKETLTTAQANSTTAMVM
ncbi:MAG: hypothetical protein K0S08_1030 [Gammaproteobacteria bacterium]|jgi:hypothetical protein|nr:hypothetical protein [Gammaproteobacteria bacterium]